MNHPAFERDFVPQLETKGTKEKTKEDLLKLKAHKGQQAAKESKSPKNVNAYFEADSSGRSALENAFFSYEDNTKNQHFFLIVN